MAEHAGPAGRTAARRWPWGVATGAREPRPAPARWPASGRRRVLTAALLAQVPLLAFAGARPDLLLAVVALAALAVGLGRLGALVRALALGGGLALAGVGLLWAAGDSAVGHLHLALVLALVPASRARAAELAAAAVAAGGYVVWLAERAAVGQLGSATLLPPLLVAGVGLVGAAAWEAARRAERRAEDLDRRLRQHEHRLARHIEDLEARKAELLASVSHEFRTPLTSLTGYARTLAARIDQLSPAAVQRCVSGIDEQATRLARLVHNLLAADGDIAADPVAVCDLAVVVRQVAAEARAAQGRDVDLSLDLPPGLRARVGLLAARTILGNLLDNAVRYAAPGSAVRVTGMRAGATVAVEIANRVATPVGGDLERLFEPFSHGCDDARVGEGLGLGLHVARRTALASAGSLSARLDGGWLRFHLTLPAPAAAHGAAAATLERGAGAAAAAGGGRRRPPRMLRPGPAVGQRSC